MIWWNFKCDVCAEVRKDVRLPSGSDVDAVLCDQGHPMRKQFSPLGGASLARRRGSEAEERAASESSTADTTPGPAVFRGGPDELFIMNTTMYTAPGVTGVDYTGSGTVEADGLQHFIVPPEPSPEA